jgi:hypothetical protein
MNTKTRVIVGVVVAVVAIVAAVLLFGHRNSAPAVESPTAQATQSGNDQSQASPTPSPTAVAGPYTSVADKFSADFKGTPSVNTATFNFPSAGRVARTEYLAQSGTGSDAKAYVVSVYHYPATYVFTNSYLSSALQLFVSAVNMKYPGSKLTDQKQTQFLGNAAVSGTISVTIGGAQSHGYVLITTKGHNLYGIGTYGLDQSGYDAFVKSFTFSQ